jgi:hypothetical protein
MGGLERYRNDRWNSVSFRRFCEVYNNNSYINILPKSYPVRFSGGLVRFQSLAPGVLAPSYKVKIIE